MNAARSAALQVFLDWDSSGEPADVLLGSRLRGLRGRDRQLATELVRGVFRWKGRLDWQLGALLRRPLDELDPALPWILRLGLYQMEHLDRVPPHAVVHTSVELAKRAAPRQATSLVNAVLRKAPAVVPGLAEPDPSVDPVAHLEARASHPRWLLERWLSRWGFRKTLALAGANNTRPPLTLRIASDRVEPGRFLPDTLRLPEGWHPALRDFLEAGLIVVQDEAAGFVAHLVRPFRGARLLDVCSAPGGKAVHFAQLAGDPPVVAADISRKRQERVRETARRVGLRHLHAVVADGTRPAFAGGFSRVLVDAPCTNTGVLAKRPDARWRRGPEDLPRLARLQGALLEAARGQVGPGGLLVYSTCSLEPEENEGVIRSYQERHPGDTLVPADEVLPAEVVRDGFLSTDPVSQRVDGAFAAVIRPGGGAMRSVS